MALNIKPILNVNGEARIEAALAQGGLGKITHLAIGRGQYHPTGTETGLADEIARTTIETVTPQDGYLEITATITCPADFVAGELAFLLEDGTPFAIHSEDPGRQYPDLDPVSGEQRTNPDGSPKTRPGLALATLREGTEIPFRYVIDVSVYGPDKLTVAAQPLNEAYSLLARRLERHVSPEDFGARGDGATNDTNFLLNWMAAENRRKYCPGRYLTDPIVSAGNDGAWISGPGKIQITELSKSVFRFTDDGAKPLLGPKIRDLVFEQPNDPAAGGGEDNNHSCLKFQGRTKAEVSDVELVGSDIALHFGYGSATLPDRASRLCAATNVVDDAVRVMGLELFGSKQGSFRGLRFSGTNGAGGRALSHGVRFSAYDFATNTGNYVEATVSGFNNGASIQRYSFGNELHLYAENCTNGLAVHGAAEGATVASLSKSNSLRVKAQGCDTGLYDGGTQNTFDVDIGGCGRGIYQQGNGGVVGLATGNTYRGQVRFTNGRLAELNGDNSTLDLSLFGKGPGANDFGLLLNGDDNSGSTNVKNCAVGVRINGSRQRLEMTVNDCDTALVVAGDDNVIEIQTDGNVEISGSNNKISGHIGGQITDTGVGTDLTGLARRSVTKALFGQVTDANGFLNITHNFGQPNVPSIDVFGYYVTMEASLWTSNQCRARVRDPATGGPLNNATGLTVLLKIDAR